MWFRSIPHWLFLSCLFSSSADLLSMNIVSSFYCFLTTECQMFHKDYCTCIFFWKPFTYLIHYALLCAKNNSKPYHETIQASHSQGFFNVKRTLLTSHTSHLVSWEEAPNPCLNKVSSFGTQFMIKFLLRLKLLYLGKYQAQKLKILLWNKVTTGLIVLCVLPTPYLQHLNLRKLVLCSFTTWHT